MEGQGAGFESSYRYHLDHFNSKLGAEASNRTAVLLALAYLPLAFNSSVPGGEFLEPPENRLGEAVFRGGLEGSIRAEESKWP